MLQTAVVLVADAADPDGPAAERLIRAVRSLAGQEDVPAPEVVVVNVAADPTAAEDSLAGLPSAPPLLDLPGAPLAEALKAGAAKTSAPLLAFADGRSEWSARKLARQSAAFARPGLDLCGHREEIVEESGRRRVVGERPSEDRWPALVRAFRRPAWSMGSTLLRRAAWQRLGGLRDGPDAWADFLLRAHLAGVPSYLLEIPLAQAPGDPPDWPDPAPELCPHGSAYDNLLEPLRPLPPDRLFGKPPADARAAACVKSGLLLLYDDLDGSHRISQDAEGHQDSDYWHAIMHRREGDFGNSGYWFRRVGRHPIFDELHRRASELLKSAVGRQTADLRTKLARTWDPFAFKDFVESCVSGSAGKAASDTARAIQLVEIQLLLEHCVAVATG